MICEMASNAGFFSGLWAGLMSVFSLIADIFFEVSVYDHCQQSWWYDLGFILGLGIIFQLGFALSWIFFLILLGAWIVTIVFKTFVYGMVFAGGALTVYTVYQMVKKDKKTDA
jgi:hypothetical protein